MASFQCAHCSRPVFLRREQLPPASGLCLPCNHARGEQRRATQAWQRFRSQMLTPLGALPTDARPLMQAVDLRHL
jgi:hypothetical protein